MIVYQLLVNLISFGMCYNDKKRAIKHQRRISEKTLLFVSFLGGAFGFFIAMHIFHHKTKHLKFILLEPFFMMMWTIILLIERGIL